jgi:hypothetical protein
VSPRREMIIEPAHQERTAPFAPTSPPARMVWATAVREWTRKPHVVRSASCVTIMNLRQAPSRDGGHAPTRATRSLQGGAQKAWANQWLASMASLISAIALPGLRCFGHVLLQFMMVLHR